MNEDKRLAKQARYVLYWIRLMGSMTKQDAANWCNCWNLPGRIYDIRQVYGDDSIETVMEPNKNGGRHARYVWRG